MKIVDGKITTQAHCCICTGICNHIGPIMVCEKHKGKQDN